MEFSDLIISSSLVGYIISVVTGCCNDDIPNNVVRKGNIFSCSVRHCPAGIDEQVLVVWEDDTETEGVGTCICYQG